jgi:hypothetical protein
MIRRILMVIAAVAWAGAAQGQTRFLAAFEDVPAPPGLVEIEDGGFSFVSDLGRIEETSASGAVEEGAVRAYYRAALPALGWSVDGDDAAGLSFLRGRERLTLAFQRGSDGLTRVRYRMVTRTSSLALD